MTSDYKLAKYLIRSPYYLASNTWIQLWWFALGGCNYFYFTEKLFTEIRWVTKKLIASFQKLFPWTSYLFNNVSLTRLE